MVITIEKLNVEVVKLENEYKVMLDSFPNAVINFALQHQANIQQTKAKIDLIHKQIGELVKDKAKEEKEAKETKEIKEVLKKK
jgi:hypothetical protein